MLCFGIIKFCQSKTKTQTQTFKTQKKQAKIYSIPLYTYYIFKQESILYKTQESKKKNIKTRQK